MNIGRFLKVGALLALTLIAGATMILAQSDEGRTDIIRVEIAEDPTRFSFDQDIVHEDGMPAYGASFITQGYIYPAGTLNGSNGVLPDGSPEFPDLVLGTWTCRGWMVGNGMYTEGEPWAVTTQIFQFGDVEDGNIITTEGYEMPDIGAPVTRVITGGSGDSLGAQGEQIQELLGFTDDLGLNFSVELRGSNFHIPATAAADDGSLAAIYPWDQE